MRRSWLAVGVGVPLVLAFVFVPRFKSSHGAQVDNPLAIAQVAGVPASATRADILEGLDLTKIAVVDGAAMVPLPDKKIARLSLDANLDRIAERLMAAFHIPEAAIVLMDVATGKVLVYANHVEKGPLRDLCVEAKAPAASVFKVVTGSALVEHVGASPDHRECYSGGEQRITPQDLHPDAKRDRWCTTLAGAMGRSLNTVFARLALRHLKPKVLDDTAHALGFGFPLPFDVPVQTSAISLPDDQLGYARTAAGFWNTTLSPLHAAWLGATIARGGEPIRPTIVDEVIDDSRKSVWTAPGPLVQRRALKPETAAALTTMMDTTVSDGTSYRAFHDGKGRPFLPNISVAGKTGTLTDAATQRFFTWFMGFAPSHLEAADEGGPRQVAFGVLVVNDPTWTVKANVLAREVLRAYFAEQKVPGVTTPYIRDGKDHDKRGSKSAHRGKR